MHIEYHRWYSPSLGQDMEMKVYGHDGKPVLVFPSSGGRFYEYEDFGMVEACKPFIESGKIRLFNVDSVDRQSWLNSTIHPDDRARRNNDYHRYIVTEVAPFIRDHGSKFEKFMVTGCSMGAYHAADFFFRHPDIFDTVVALSGVYGAMYLLGDFISSEIYFHFPLNYLPNLNDPWFVDQYKKSKIVICVGQGAWENECVTDTKLLQQILESKGVNGWFDYWGYDIVHDWCSWRVQIVYFLNHLNW